MTDSICYFNGKLIHQKECDINISDLMIQRGYGVFDYFRSRNGKILWLDDYMKRLFNSINKSGFDFAFTKTQVIEIIEKLHKINNFKNSSFKVIVTGGYSNDLSNIQNQPNLVILNNKFQKPNIDFYRNGANLISFNFQRPDAEIKTLNYFTALKLQKQLTKYNASDVLYHDGSFIFETSRANIFCVKDDIIYTPKNGILKGITRSKVLDLLKPHFRSLITDISYKGLFNFDEVFITSSSKDIMPIVQIDGNNISTGKVGIITREIMRMFDEETMDIDEAGTTLIATYRD
jgi:branched-subunit amino acid aminotransferase/4-amino-4-deoxychorismate lyase